MDQFLTYIDQRRARLIRRLERTQRALSELDKSERLYRASGAAPKGAKKGQATKPGLVSRDTSQAALPLEAASEGTIKQRVLAILENHPLGLTSGQILDVLRSSGLPELARESLSPQLSRLKKEEQIVSNHGLWMPQKHETHGG